MEKFKKYKWLILTFILYLSIVHILISTSHLSSRKIFPTELFYDVVVPIVIYMLYSLWRYYKNHKDGETNDIFDEGTTNNFSEQHVTTTATSTSDVYKPCAFAEAWTFMSFVKIFGPKIGIASHMNNRTNVIFHTCEVSDSNGRTVSVRFDSSLGELTSKQLKERKMELWVGKRKDNNRYYLYDKNYKEWLDIDL